MNYFIELNDEDVTRIIAEKFAVPMSDVFVETVCETRGYGPMEHDEHVVKVTVRKVLGDVEVSG